jgi:hypothetical protein
VRILQNGFGSHLWCSSLFPALFVFEWNAFCICNTNLAITPLFHTTIITTTAANNTQYHEDCSLWFSGPHGRGEPSVSVSAQSFLDSPLHKPLRASRELTGTCASETSCRVPAGFCRANCTGPTSSTKTCQTLGQAPCFNDTGVCRGCFGSGTGATCNSVSCMPKNTNTSCVPKCGRGPYDATCQIMGCGQPHSGYCGMRCAVGNTTHNNRCDPVVPCVAQSDPNKSCKARAAVGAESLPIPA